MCVRPLLDWTLMRTTTRLNTDIVIVPAGEETITDATIDLITVLEIARAAEIPREIVNTIDFSQITDDQLDELQDFLEHVINRVQQAANRIRDRETREVENADEELPHRSPNWSE